MVKSQLNQRPAESGSTDRLLRVIIALLIRRKDDQIMPLKTQIQILDSLGMRPVEIAETIGKTQTHVNKELVAIRKNTKREG